jgi:two-component system, OmpR family, sensor kinase
VSRLPARLQVTLAFAAALAVVLAAAGTFVYLRFEAELMRTVDRGLETRAATVSALRRSGADLDTARARLEQEESFAVVLSPSGAVLDSTPGAPDVRLTAEERRRAPVFLDREHGAADGEPARLLAVPRGGELIVVGDALDDQREALAALATLGGIGLLAVLALASAAGYWAAGIAQRLTHLERSRAAEQAALAKERRFIADASHELRTPLTILKSEIDVALSADRPAAELRAALASVGEEADRLIRLAQDLLVLARADEGELPIAPETVPVRELLEDVAARNRRRGEISVAAPPDLTVSADRERLRQALTNMLDNALRHGGAPVELSAEDGDGQVRIAVRDHGPGFPPGFSERAFERFARPDAGRSGGGAGLGLAIVDAIARAHGGTAAVAEAEPGARVTIALPDGSSIHHRDRAS